MEFEDCSTYKHGGSPARVPFKELSGNPAVTPREVAPLCALGTSAYTNAFQQFS